MMLPWNVNQLGPEREGERKKEGEKKISKRETLNNIRAIPIPKSSQFTRRPAHQSRGFHTDCIWLHTVDKLMLINQTVILWRTVCKRLFEPCCK